MKKIILAAALLSITFVSCNNNGASKNNEQSATEATATGTSARSSASIAYINMDSLLMNYDMYKELQSEFEAKAKQAGDNLNSRGTKLQRDIADFQEKAEKVLITRAQAVEMEAALQKRQQDYMQYSNKIQNELAEEEGVMLNRIHYSITAHVRELNANYKYSMILSTSSSIGTILDADPSLDITKEVLSGLNRKYTESKKK